MEKEKSNSISFLDVKINRNIKDNSISTSTFHKPTFTEVMLNWNSLTSIKYKNGLIGCLLDRSYKICSTDEQKVIEMEELRILFLKNNYPQQISETEFERFRKLKQFNVDKQLNSEEKINIYHCLISTISQRF